MNRRTFVTASSAALLTPVLGFSAKRVAAQASPMASPVAVTGPIVSDYAEIGPAYEAMRAETLTWGREITDRFFSGDSAAVFERLSPDVNRLITEESLTTLIPSLQTDRVRFEIPEVGVIFDGHLEGRTIEGYFKQGGLGSFTLTAEGGGTPTAASPLDGLWKGEIVAGEFKLGIEVTFRTEGDTLTGTISIPEQQAVDIPLSNVAFMPTVTLGERFADEALPASMAYRFYAARYSWDAIALAVSVVFAPDGQIPSFTVAPEWPLPPDPAADYQSAVTYHLPFEGVWWVFWGGDTIMQNYHVESPAQRHAYDILIWKDGSTYRGDGTRNEDYLAFGQPLYAPAAGTVAAAVDGVPDNTPGVLNPAQLAGNHVVIQTAEQEFVHLVHMQQGSVRVKQGDRVTTGQLLGLTGNSGNSSEAHLHIHAQDKVDILDPSAIGLPLRFSDYLANGEPVARDIPVQGQFIERGNA